MRSRSVLVPLLVAAATAMVRCEHPTAGSASRSPPPSPSPLPLPSPLPSPSPSPSLSPSPSPSLSPPTARVVARAREEVARAVGYDPRWYPISYPGGDVDPSIGVCTDVVIRAYRAAGLDFQKLVHEDVLRAPTDYRSWVKSPDATIDHRRVGPLMTYLKRHATRLPNDDDASYQAGDVVVISFERCPACGPAHIGIVSDRRGPRGLPLLLHNMGPVPREDDTLDAWTRIGHYRVF